jgi:ATP-dependent helicase/nuclease subunit A
MSIHQSKGQEFPIVAVADLAKPFNMQDLRGEIIFDEAFGLCPRVKPPHTGRRYPSLPHWLAQQHQRREQWGEELRLLYVATTRAQDTLILTGAITQKKWETLWTQPAAITTQAIVAAKSYADWLGLWFAHIQVQRVHPPSPSYGAMNSPQSTIHSALAGELPHLRWRIVDDKNLAEGGSARWGETPGEPSVSAEFDSTSGSRGRSPHQLESLDAATAERLRAMLSWEYPFAAATERPAKSSVTALRRQAEELDDEAEQVFRPQFSAKRLAPPSKNPQSATPMNREHATKVGVRNPQLNAAETGTAHHKFLQHVALENAADVAALESEAGRLEREKVLSADERAALNLEDIAAFWSSEPGQKIRKQAANVRRELAFTARFSPAELAAVTGAKSEPGLEAEFVVVQGVADLVVLLPKEIWLVDFKTDEIRKGELPDRIKTYTPQLKLYAQALEKIYSRPVTEHWLHFLSARKTV